MREFQWGQPARSAPVAFNRHRAAVDAAAFYEASRDPFRLADPCADNPAGHLLIASCGQVVCAHCSKIFGG